MQIESRTLRMLLTAGVMLVLLTALVPGALSDKSYMEKGWSKSGHEIKSVDMVKTVTGMTGDTVSFEVPTVAITGKEGKVATMTFPTPLTGAYNLRYGGGYISMQGARSADIAVRPISNATMNIAGASMVASMKDIKVLSDDRDSFSFEYRKMGLVLPDGTAREYYLDKPVKVTYSKDRRMVLIDAYPSIGDITAYAYTNNARFPGDTAPIGIQEMRNAEMIGRVETIGTAPILRPEATATPTATATPVPTEVPTATPIVSPTVTPVPTEVPTATPEATPTQVTAPVPSL